LGDWHGRQKSSGDIVRIRNSACDLAEQGTLFTLVVNTDAFRRIVTEIETVRVRCLGHTLQNA
jgi:hypothetical protein